MSYELQIIIIAILTSVSCSLLGSFLVLRKMAMLSDAISHTSLLGIVIMYFIVKSLNSPFLILGASLMGVITVVLVEYFKNTNLMKEETSIGFVMTFLFSISIFIISKFLKNVHIDNDSILMGEITFSPLNTITIFNSSIPKSIVVSVILIILNLLFVILFFKELKIITFDKNFATSLGIKVKLINYVYIILVSLTAVSSFEIVGSILIISFLIGPPVISYIYSKSLIKMIVLSIIISIISTIIGVKLAINFNVSIAGMIACIIGIIFIFSISINKIMK